MKKLAQNNDVKHEKNYVRSSRSSSLSEVIVDPSAIPKSYRNKDQKDGISKMKLDEVEARINKYYDSSSEENE